MLYSRVLRNSPYLLVEAMKTRNLAQSRKDVIDLGQANRMQATLRHLNLFDTPPLVEGQVLPLCYHLAYFTPDLAESQLSVDGADPTFNPGNPFSRRMWSGGKMTWEQGNALRIGQSVEETTTLEKVESKQTRDKQSMIVVTGKKAYYNEDGLALTDLRSWLFREPSNEMHQARPVRKEDILDGATLGSVTASEITLFRYSALTFNSHRIHYDREHTRSVEGHPEVVVHGPLNITLLANVYQKAFGRAPRNLKYRALSPVYVNEEYKVMHNDSSVWCATRDGRTIMSAIEE